MIVPEDLNSTPPSLNRWLIVLNGKVIDLVVEQYREILGTLTQGR